MNKSSSASFNKRSSRSTTKKNEMNFELEDYNDEIPTAVVVGNEDSPMARTNSNSGSHENIRRGSFKGGLTEVERRNSIGGVKHADPNFTKSKDAIKSWPPMLKDTIIRSFSKVPDETKAGEFLSQYNWPIGLKETVFKSVRKIAFRFFIVDDSGSMILNDGNRLVTHGNNTKLVKCTRWSELSASLLFLGELSESLQAPSEFRLLNGADPIIVGLGDDNGESLNFFKEVLHESPAGPTPLCIHINAVVAEITSIEQALKAGGQKVVVMIATDGESSDGDVADALRPLTNLPVLVILRLCTGEQQVIDYWNSIDNQLEIDIDVLDDQLGDAKQVHQINGWLTYAEPLHRLREFGASMKELDIIDESTMSSEQMRVICAYLFLGGNAKELPHPGVDWHQFVTKVKQLNAREPKVFCTITNTMKPWVDIKQLNRIYGSEMNASSTCNIM